MDSAALVERQWRRWASARGLRAEPFLRVCHGRRAVETIRIAAPHLDAEAEVAAFRPPDEEHSGEVGPMAGAARLLSALPSGSWAVATSGSRAGASARLRAAKLPVPPALVCAEDVLRGKPSPDVYLTASARLEVAPSDCLVVEDAPACVEAASAAGMRVIALGTTHAFDQLPADIQCHSLAGVHLGRVETDPRGGRLLEILVIEA